MPTSALYTNVGRVARSLAFQTPENIKAIASIGNSNITLNSTPPSDWQVGTQLLIDSNSDNLQEIVTITGTPIGLVVPISVLTKNHVVGAPVINITVLNEFVAAASRWWDSATYTPGGYAYEAYVDKKEAFVGNDGLIVIPLSKPMVNLSDITNVTFQSNPLMPVYTLDLTKAWVINDYLLKIYPTVSPMTRQGFATVNYSGGYNPLPDDIISAVTMYAARLYKERDSGYSDTVGNADYGKFQYKKSIPTDIAAVINFYQRWTI